MCRSTIFRQKQLQSNEDSPCWFSSAYQKHVHGPPHGDPTPFQHVPQPLNSHRHTTRGEAFSRNLAFLAIRTSSRRPAKQHQSQDEATIAASDSANPPSQRHPYTGAHSLFATVDPKQPQSPHLEHVSPKANFYSPDVLPPN